MEVMSPHTKRVMGISVDRKMGFLYTISEDGKFKVTEINGCSVVASYTPGKSGLKCMIHNPKRACFIIGDGDGFIYVYGCVSVRFLSHDCL